MNFRKIGENAHACFGLVFLYKETVVEDKKRGEWDDNILRRIGADAQREQEQNEQKREEKNENKARSSIPTVSAASKKIEQEKERDEETHWRR